MDKKIARLSKGNPLLTAPEIRYKLNLEVSTRTVQRRLVEAGLHGRRQAEKPYISSKARKTRLCWAKEHLNWSQEDWKKVLYSDEAPFQMIGNGGKSFVRRPKGKRNDPKYTKGTVKYGGGKIMVWGCFSWNSAGPLVHVKKNSRSKKGGMDAIQYRDEILEAAMLPFANVNMPLGWVSYSWINFTF